MKRAISMLGAMAVAAGFFLFGAPAANAQVPTCTDYHVINPGAPTNYPNNGKFFTCFNGVSLTNAEKIRDQMAGVGSGAQLAIRNLLDAQDVKVFYFANRTEANAYFTANPDYTGAFASSTARCANTYARKVIIPASHRIAIAIYKDCTYATGTPLNPDYVKVTSHEKGHAFAFALAKSQGRLPGPDRSSGYATGVSSLADFDRTTLNTIASTCSIFSTYLPSGLENDLGTPNDAVCNTGGSVIGQYVGKTNRQIADIRAPYFVNPVASERYADLWAEQFSIFDSGLGGSITPKVLQLTDEILKENRMRCTAWVVKSFYNTLLPVGPNNPNIAYKQFPVAWGCPAVTEAQQWQ